MSYRAPTRYPGIPVHVISHRDAESRNTGKGRYPQATLYWTPHRVRGDEPVIPHLMRNPVNTGKSTHKIHFPLRSLTGPRAATRGDGICSFFSAARRTNQEAPPLLSGYLARRLAPPSGAAELAALKQSSPLFLNRLASSRPDKGGGIATLHRKCPGHFAVRYPKIYRPISSFRATTRNPEIPGHGITQDARAMRHYSTLCHPEAGPRVECGVTQCASRVG